MRKPVIAVASVFVALLACSSGSSTDKCTYPDAGNSPVCPSSVPAEGEACTTPGLVCTYPGAGDFTDAGCRFDAVATCNAADGGGGAWHSSG